MSPQDQQGTPNAKKFPAYLTGPLVDFGPTNPDVYQVTLDSSDLMAIRDAVEAFNKSGVAKSEISKDSFQLPSNLDEKLTKAATAVHDGTGVCIIRGLDPASYSDSDNLVVFLGISAFIGDKHGVQDKKGNVISHIIDSKTWKVPYEKRHGVHTNQPLSWHCDMGADVLALQIRQVAAHGGTTSVASLWRVYNDLMAKLPGVIETLAEPTWPVQVSSQKLRYVLAPLLDFHENKLMVNLDPSRLGQPKMNKAKHSSRVEAIPPLTDVQLGALSALSSAAERHKVELDTHVGDLVFINNWAQLHARSAYVDMDSESLVTAPRRHLLRLWLRNSKLGWNVPESLLVPWDAAFGNTIADEGYVSGEYSQSTAPLVYAVYPEVDYKPSRYICGSAAFVLDDSDSEGEMASDAE